MRTLPGVGLLPLAARFDASSPGTATGSLHAVEAVA